jgi:hypothetical protein
MAMDFLLNTTFWIGLSIFFIIGCMGLGIFYVILFKKTHVGVELRAMFTNTPIGIFFQDNKFAEWKPITPINGVIYDKVYGPFIVGTTYVDKKTKNIIIPFDVDMDGDRTTNIKKLVDKFRHVTNNDKSICALRSAISSDMIVDDSDIDNMTSNIKYSTLKELFVSYAPHSIRSKIEKIVAEKLVKFGNVNAMQAVIVFGAIFGIIVIAAILLKTTGGV